MTSLSAVRCQLTRCCELPCEEQSGNSCTAQLHPLPPPQLHPLPPPPQVIAKFAELNDGSSWYKEHWVNVDATGSIEQIHGQICSHVGAAMSACAAGAPIRQLWDYSCISQQALHQASEQHRQQEQQGAAQAARTADVADAVATSGNENLPSKAAKAVPAVADTSGQDVLKQRQ